MNRIDLLASLAKDSNVLLDVGCDHAYTVISACKNYNVKKAIASDIGNLPLEVAKSNIIKSGLQEQIKIVKSDGLKQIDDDFDTLIISGMGGLLIKDILNSSTRKIKNKKLILSPNRDYAEVRLFLSENGFNIIDEYAFYDNKIFYEIIVAIPGNMNVSSFEIKYGPILLQKKDADFIDYYHKQYDKLSNALKNTKKDSEKDNLKSLISDYQKIIE